MSHIGERDPMFVTKAPPPDLDQLKAALAATDIFGMTFSASYFIADWSEKSAAAIAEALNAAPGLIDEIGRLTQESRDKDAAAHAVITSQERQIKQLRVENETLKSDPTGSYAMGEQKIAGLLGVANTEIKRLRGELAKAKAIGAAEGLERLAMWARSVALVDDAEPGDWRDTLARVATRRAAELRKEAE